MSSYLAKADNLSGLANTTTARSNLGLGSIATQSASSVAITGGSISTTTFSGTLNSVAVQSGTGITFLTDVTTQNTAYPGPSGFLLKADNLSGLANTATARSNLGLGTMATQNASAVVITGGTMAGGFSGVFTASASTTTNAGLRITPGVAPSAPVNGDIWTTTNDLLVRLNGVTETVAEQSWVTAQGYLTSAALTPYLTSANASATYFTIANAANKADLASPVFTGDPRAPTPSLADNDTSIATTAFVKGQGYLTSAPVTSVAGRTGAITLSTSDISGLGTAATFADTAFLKTANNLSDVTASTARTNLGLGTAAVEPATKLVPAGGTTGQVLVKNSNTDWDDSWATISSGATWGSITGTLSSQTDLQSALDAKAALAGATFTGKVNTPTSTATTAGLNVPHGTAPTTPVNGDIWTTTTGLNARINGATKTYANLNDTQTFVAAMTFSNPNNSFGVGNTTGTVGLASGNTASGSTKTVNIGTGGQAGSTTNITIGATAGTSTTTLNGTVSAPGLTNSVKAWVNFNGTGTVAIRASYNVTSITDNGVGDYTVNMTNAMANTNYIVVPGHTPAINLSGTAGAWFAGLRTDASGNPVSKTTSAFRVGTSQLTGGSQIDVPEAYFAVIA